MRRLSLGFFALLLFPAASWAQFQLPQPAPIRPVVVQPVVIQPIVPIAPVYTPTVNAPVIIGADGTYLGQLSNNPYDPNSVSNPYGKYGSPYSPDSVNNPYGKFGSPYSPTSATNPYAAQAPVIIAPDGTNLGRLSANPYGADSTANPFSPAGSPFSPTSVNNPFSPYYNPLLVPPTKKK